MTGIDVGEIFPLVLAAQADVVQLAVDRFYPNRIPQRDEVPAIVFERAGGSEIPTLEGYAGVYQATYTLTAICAESQQQAQQLRNAALAIKSSRGRIGAWWVQAINVVQGSEIDEPQIPVQGDDKPFFASSAEFTVFYKRGQ